MITIFRHKRITRCQESIITALTALQMFDLNYVDSNRINIFLPFIDYLTSQVKTRFNEILSEIYL